jgi:hypothetical protein
LTEWLAIAIGLAGGLLLSYHLGKAALVPLVARSRKPELLIKLSLGGTVIAALPALLLSIVVGATLGMPWDTVGIVIGVAAVFALLLLCGTFAGVLLARLLTRPGA